MADFTVKDKFDPAKGFTDVIFGADTELLEVELNEMQKIQREARASLARQMVHSGVLDFKSGVVNVSNVAPASGQVGYFSPTSNFFNSLTIPDTNSIVNGYKLLIHGEKDSYDRAILPTPPTIGTRDDLVFLEAWFEEIDAIEDPSIKDSRIGAETSRRTKLNWRIRTVAGIDFGKFPEGFKQISYAYADAPTRPQGGNAEPLIYQSAYPIVTTFVDANQRGVNDYGLYMAGDGTQASKDILKTVDGYVYAIPLFRVKRRNNTGFSVANSNGARDYILTTTKWTVEQTFTHGATYTNIPVTSTAGLVVGGKYYLYTNNDHVMTITAIGSNTISFLYTNVYLTGSSTFGTSDGYAFRTAPDRPDGLYANIIDQRDIIDLRHKVSLTGVNYKQLLEENFDKLLRGELQTKDKTKMLKTYHGVRKTPIDANHVFYASLDGTTVAELGGSPIANPTGGYGFKPSITGIGSTDAHRYTVDLSSDVITIDVAVVGTGTMLTLRNSSKAGFGGRLVELTHDSIGVLGATEAIGYTYTAFSSPATRHIRVVIKKSTKNVKCYVDGKLVLDTIANYLDIANFTSANCTVCTNVQDTGNASFTHQKPDKIVSDLAISNIDRGAVFATLPQDFMDGYARIMLAFDNQRKNLSDAQMSLVTSSVAKPKAQTSDRGITVTKGAGVNNSIWETGDIIKVKGLAGEVITGAIDSDTALAKVISADGTTTITVDKVDGLAVSDTLVLWRASTNSFVNATVVAIDNTTKKVTLSIAVASDWSNVSYIVESTASTSSPVVKASIDGATATTLTGTWTNLGTNEATFTLGTNTNLDTEDIRIDFTLNTPGGEGGVPEVLTKTLAGEYSGQKLVVGAPTLKADFRNKVVGSVVENPHVAKYDSATGLRTPSVFANEFTSGHYASLVLGVSSLMAFDVNTNGALAQQLFSINLLAEAERQLGQPIPKLTLADKVQWLKDNLTDITANWYGFGSSVGGNKANLTAWQVGATTWGATPRTHTSSTVSAISITLLWFDTLANLIDPNGFVHLLAYADASNGVIASNILTDYVSLDITFKTPTGYDALTPEEPFHNGQTKNFLFVRKETKEIQTFTNADEDFGIVTYGDYVPTQEVINPTNTNYVDYFDKVVCLSDKAHITSLFPSRLGTRTMDISIEDMGAYFTYLHNLLPDKEIARLVAQGAIVNASLDGLTSLSDWLGANSYTKESKANPSLLYGSVLRSTSTRLMISVSREVPLNTPGIFTFMGIKGSELYLGIAYGLVATHYANVNKVGTRVLSSYTGYLVIPLQGRPLIKGVN